MADRFKLKAKNLLLTWPRNDKTPQEIIDGILLFFESRVPSPEWIVCVQETHEDGSPHIHAVLRLDKQATIRGAATLDIVAGKHGDYKAIGRGLKRAVRYLTKENEPVVWPVDLDMDQFLDKTKSKWDSACGLIRGGLTVHGILATGWEDGFMAQNIRRLKVFERTVALSAVPERRTWKMEVLIYWGPPGTGKTRKAFTDHPGAYMKGNSKWWGGYLGQETVIVDDFAPMEKQWSFDYWLRLLDRYPCRVECKGDDFEFVSRRIIITSNHDPALWWFVDNKAAFFRRVTKIIRFPEVGDPIEEDIDLLFVKSFTPLMALRARIHGNSALDF